MTPEELKYSILKLAFSGRLVTQIEQEVVNCKNAFNMDETPFDVPEKWKWNYIGNICDMYTGDSIAENIKKTKYEGLKEGFDYIGTKDVSFDHKIAYDNGVRIPFNNDFKRAYSDCILMCIEGGSAGRKIAILDKEVCFGNKLCMFNAQTIFNKFLYYYLQSSEFKSIFKDNLSGIIGGVSIKKIKSILIPIPPFEEQKRIVAKIEELLPLVDRYEEAWNKLELLNKKFPVDMEHSLLQFAFTGKLVEQKECEGTGKQLLSMFKSKKKVLAFDDDEFPFEIPESWTWVHLNEISDSMLGKTINKSLDTGEETKYLCSINVYWEGIDLSMLKTAKFSRDEKDKYLLKQGDLLICEGGDVGRSALWESEKEMYYQNALHRVRFYSRIVPRFYLYVLKLYKANSMIKKHSKGETIKHLVQGELNSMPFPLPPYDEQKRIVAKIEELLPLCRKLVK